MVPMLIILTVFVGASAVSNTLDMLIDKEISNNKILTTVFKSTLTVGSIATMAVS